MSSPETINLSRLIEPVADGTPVGSDLRAAATSDSIYYQIKDARSKARAAERQVMMGDTEASAPDWSPLLNQVPNTLEEDTKDLEITAYLIEALVRKHGFAGLRDGFQLAAELVERYGDDIFPLPDEDGIETRVAAFIGLNGADSEGTLIAPIRQIPITVVGDVGPFGYGEYIQAKELERADPDAKASRVAQGAVPIEDFEAASLETPAEFFNDLLDDITECQSQFGRLSAAMDAKYGDEAPPVSQIREILQACRDTVLLIGKDKITQPEDPEQSTDEGEGDEGEESAPAKSAVTIGEILNREDAFREILKVAHYFRRTEPHTPISYALEQIVRWGRLPLPDLLKELINDESSIDQMFKLVGIQKLGGSGSNPNE